MHIRQIADAGGIRECQIPVSDNGIVHLARRPASRFDAIRTPIRRTAGQKITITGRVDPTDPRDTRTFPPGNRGIPIGSRPALPGNLHTFIPEPEGVFRSSTRVQKLCVFGVGNLRFPDAVRIIDAPAGIRFSDSVKRQVLPRIPRVVHGNQRRQIPCIKQTGGTGGERPDNKKSHSSNLFFLFTNPALRSEFTGFPGLDQPPDTFLVRELPAQPGIVV